LEEALQADGKGCSIYVLVSNDTDSLASLKILTKLMKEDEVMFSVNPVFSRKSIAEELLKISKEAKELKSLIFLNCGADIDLSQTDIYKVTDASFYLVDSHRPIHHKNINAEKIFVIQDHCPSFEECPTK
jgi:hypothetical protein